MSSIHECKASLLNYHIIAMNICRLICPRITDLTPSKETLILNVIKWCFQTHFPCTIQAQDCQLLKERGYPFGPGGTYRESGNSEKMAVIMSVLTPAIFWNNFFYQFSAFLKQQSVDTISVRLWSQS